MSTPRQPTSKEISMKALCQAQHKKDWAKPEVVYQFSNGRKFVSTDRTEKGVYKRT